MRSLLIINYFDAKLAVAIYINNILPFDWHQMYYYVIMLYCSVLIHVSFYYKYYSISINLEKNWFTQLFDQNPSVQTLLRNCKRENNHIVLGNFWLTCVDQKKDKKCAYFKVNSHSQGLK